ncbi:hypothetical protein B0J12DRAFT_784871 [Macrophomina phaseolina]|uniref:Uncharacterized protein n=1 Tax=Macrophomina phaseolina TaxID=35725 RepID=A0ABQ8GEG9_9PEZI|nr:hypothetical protein B0J12DRAFT_784871 [Macrophomina phaseolina]
MPSPPISPTSLSPSTNMNSLASILHQTNSGPGGASSPAGNGSTAHHHHHQFHNHHQHHHQQQQSTSSKSTPAPPTGAFQYGASPPPPPQHRGSGTLSPPVGRASIVASPVHPLSPTTAQSAAHTAVQDLPFYHQLEQVQRVREGKFQQAGAGGGTAAAAMTSVGGGLGAGAADAAAAWASEGEAVARDGGAATPSAKGAGGAPVFERQMQEVEIAKEVLRKAGGGFYPPGGAGAPVPGQWGVQQPGLQGDMQVKVQVQGDGKARSTSFYAAVDVVCATTPFGDRGLRDTAVEAARRCFGKLADDVGFERLAQKNISIVLDVAKAGYEKEPRGYASPACQESARFRQSLLGSGKSVLYCSSCVKKIDREI